MGAVDGRGVERRPAGRRAGTAPRGRERRRSRRRPASIRQAGDGGVEDAEFARGRTASGRLCGSRGFRGRGDGGDPGRGHVHRAGRARVGASEPRGPQTPRGAWDCLLAPGSSAVVSSTTGSSAAPLPETPPRPAPPARARRPRAVYFDGRPSASAALSGEVTARGAEPAGAGADSSTPTAAARGAARPVCASGRSRAALVTARAAGGIRAEPPTQQQRREVAGSSPAEAIVRRRASTVRSTVARSGPRTAPSRSIRSRPRMRTTTSGSELSDSFARVQAPGPQGHRLHVQGRAAPRRDSSMRAGRDGEIASGGRPVPRNPSPDAPRRRPRRTSRTCEDRQRVAVGPRRDRRGRRTRLRDEGDAQVVTPRAQPLEPVFATRSPGAEGILQRRLAFALRDPSARPPQQPRRQLLGRPRVAAERRRLGSPRAALQTADDPGCGSIPARPAAASRRSRARPAPGATPTAHRRAHPRARPRSHRAPPGRGALAAAVKVVAEVDAESW